MQHWQRSLVDSATLSHNLVTNRLFSTTFGVLFLAVACTTPVPVTPSATPLPPEGSAVATAATASVTTPATPRAAVAPLAPTLPEGLTAQQQAAVAQARLLQGEGDYAAAAEQWRSLLSVPAAAVRFPPGMLAVGQAVP